ncbi:MAG TPA: LamG-like jellyroll fold domain-containing protein, partial [Planctomycetota bacterium]|nr:LamG-like jellyroll fold domain-containing protein [Planctomycetota bacterium]
ALVSGGELRLGSGSALTVGDGDGVPARLSASGATKPRITTSGTPGTHFYGFTLDSDAVLAVTGLEVFSTNSAGLTVGSGATFDNGTPGAISGVDFDRIQASGTYLRFLGTAGPYSLANCTFGNTGSPNPFNIFTPAGAAVGMIDATVGNGGIRKGESFENDHASGTDPNPATSTINWGTAAGAPAASSVDQYRATAGTAIAAGGATPQDVTFKATASDPDGQVWRLEVEVRLTSAAFTGTATHTSAFVASGAEASATAAGLADGDYHWRYRLVDSGGSSTAWVSFGGSDGTADFTRDTVNPTVTISSSASDPTGSTPVPFTVTFSENVSGFDATDVVVANGVLGGFAGSGSTYTFSVTPTASGVTVTVDVAAGVAADAAANANTAATQFTRSYIAGLRVWDGGGLTNNWSDADNWNPDAVPSATETAYFNGTSTKTCTIDVDVAVAGLQIRSGYTGTISVANGITATWGTNGFVQDAGTFTAPAGRMNVAGPFTRTGGTFNHNGGTVVFASTTDRTIASSGAVFNHVAFNDGPTAYWTLNNVGTFALDSSGNIAGTLRNGAGFSTTVPPAVTFPNSHSMQFDGVDDYVDLGTSLPLLQGVSQATLAAWIRVDSLGSIRRILQIGRGGAPSTLSRAGIHVLASGALSSVSRAADGDAGQEIATPGAVITAGTWHHVAAVFDYAAGQVRLYVDGVQVHSQAATYGQPRTDATPSAMATIGSEDDGTADFFHGLIDDVRVYGRGLAASEIATLAGGAQAGSLATYTLSGNLTVAGDLALHAGALDVGAGPAAITVAGSWQNGGGRFVPRTGTVTFNGAAAGREIVSREQSFHHLTVNGAGGVWTAR